MTRRLLFFVCAPLVLAVVSIASLGYGLDQMSLSGIVATLVAGDAEGFEEAVLLYQRVPRALIAIYVGAVTAIGGVVLQGLVRNPLAAR
ncbi:MAG: iron chelate uptake ABC transporter family permease subunit, partial [Rhodospirillales bacterium]|nr:iron chelate uptake ABC transporter family permease subunit [Rhodospirillales bacterium]